MRARRQAHGVSCVQPVTTELQRTRSRLSQEQGGRCARCRGLSPVFVCTRPNGGAELLCKRCNGERAEDLQPTTLAVLKERPILFSAPMVRALLEGRKSQTRRLVKLPPWLAKRHTNLVAAWPDPGLGDGGYLKVPHCDDGSDVANISVWMWPVERVRCPYGDIGDRLWVRETHGTTTGNGIRTVYRADGEPRELLTGRLITGLKWTPSIFMRRHQSRITLEITGLRVERLQAISHEDVIDEGFEESHDGFSVYPLEDERPGVNIYPDATSAYRDLWAKINGRASWDANPWVWVVEFRKLEEQERAA